MAHSIDHDLAKDSLQFSGMVNKPLLEFTSKIFKPFASEKNVVMSPLSIHKALSMVLLGANEGSQAKDELVEVLGLKNFKQHEIYKCLSDYMALITEFKRMTNKSQEVQEKAVVGRYGIDKPPSTVFDLFSMIITRDQGDILPEYEREVGEYFGSSIVKVDDQTKSDILGKLNSWAQEAGFSQPIMTQEQLEGQFAAILLTAIRLESNWLRNFQEHNSESVIFYNHGNKNQPVTGTVLTNLDLSDAKYLELTSADKAQYKLLHKKLSKCSSFEELSGLNVQVAEVPLRGDLSFAIFEPCNPGGAGGELDELVNKLMQTDETSAPSKLEKVFSLLDSELGANPIEEIKFPKFKFENDINVKAHLQSIGLKRVFNRMSSQISKMTTKPLYIDKISHQAMIDVNKHGIKAAGVTKIFMKLTCTMMRVKHDPIIVDIEKPFLFTIRYRKLPLFIGRLDALDNKF